MHVDEINWLEWKPKEYAVLCFVIQEERILLIHKKRGLGAGKINGPGGRIERGETALDAAIRETQEEIGVTLFSLKEIGKLHFEFVDGYKLHVTVFTGGGCSGELIETDEATPFWVNIADIPYDEMWRDDEHWLPLAIKTARFSGYFVFDGDRLLSHRVVVL